MYEEGWVEVEGGSSMLVEEVIQEGYREDFVNPGKAFVRFTRIILEDHVPCKFFLQRATTFRQIAATRHPADCRELPVEKGPFRQSPGQE